MRPPVVTHEQAARMPKLEEGFNGLDVVVPVNDVWFFRHVLQVREHGNTRRANLVGNLSKLRRVHHRLLPGRSQAEREVPQRGLCACTVASVTFMIRIRKLPLTLRSGRRASAHGFEVYLGRRG